MTGSVGERLQVEGCPPGLRSGICLYVLVVGSLFPEVIVFEGLLCARVVETTVSWNAIAYQCGAQDIDRKPNNVCR